jgi:hypothetical protein
VTRVWPAGAGFVRRMPRFIIGSYALYPLRAGRFVAQCAGEGRAGSLLPVGNRNRRASLPPIRETAQRGTAVERP